MPATIVCADVMQWAETTPPIGAHALLCDPPYHLTDVARTFQGHGGSIDAWTGHERSNQRRQSPGFMGKDWDGGDIAFRPATWAALARHLLPGAFVMAFASSRGYHRLACAMEDAGLILHPSVFNYRTGELLDIGLYGWGFGSGFPKATKIDTHVDRAVGAARAYAGEGPYASKRPKEGYRTDTTFADDNYVRPRGDARTAPATPLAHTWAGHRYGGQALKPALEPIIVAQVPYAGRPVDSITTHGAGALWIEGARLAGPHWERPTTQDIRGGGYNSSQGKNMDMPRSGAGRWPAHFTLEHLPQCQPLGVQQVPGTNIPGPGVRGLGYHGTPRKAEHIQNYADPDGTETVQAFHCAPGCVVAAFDRQAGERKAGGNKECQGQLHGYMEARVSTRNQTYDSYADDGPASRFFHVSDWSLDVAEQLAHADPVRYEAKAAPRERHSGLEGRNQHPCLKPLTLCKWLAVLLLPPAAYAPRRLLVPFCGTSSEIIGGILAGFEIVLGIERDVTTVEIGRKRIAWWTGMRPQTEAMAVHEEPVIPRADAQTQLPLF